MQDGRSAVRSRAVIFILLTVSVFAMPARAQLVISNDPTSNMNCTATECDATQQKATLNVKDVTDRLKKSDMTVKGVIGSPLEVLVPISWHQKSTLSLQAQAPLIISAAMTVAGKGGVSLSESPDFFSGGSLTFADIKSQLRIDGHRYKLTVGIKDLATNILKKARARYALANDYSADADGTYKRSPIAQTFFGKLEGLGHTISKLKIVSKQEGTNVGLFSEVSGDDSFVENLRLVDVSVAGGEGASVGALVGHVDSATINNVFVSGAVSAPAATAGGLAGSAFGAFLSQCASAADVDGNIAGGLVGYFEDFNISDSMATGRVTAHAGASIPIAGGLIGKVRDGNLATSYSTGLVGGGGNAIGGLVGDHVTGFFANTYWDTTTSGTTIGCGGDNCHTGLTGLTTSQLQAGLPSGFNNFFWGETAGINDGMPYLFAAAPD